MYDLRDIAELHNHTDDEIATATALWRASLVSLFRHYKFAPVKEIPTTMDRAAELLAAEHGDPSIVDRYELWKTQRDQTAAHPIAIDEVHLFGVDPETGKLKLRSMFNWHPSNIQHEIDPFLHYLITLRTLVDDAKNEAQARLSAEVSSLSRAELDRLPPFRYKFHGRRFGA